MGVIIKSHSSFIETAGLPQPIIYCQANVAGISEAVSLNIPLARELASMKPIRRTMRLEQCFKQQIDNLPENPVVKEFDVLFNPDYKVDILKVMSAVGKSKPFQVIWPGRFADGYLIYAEEGFRDYKVFEVNKYDVTVVV